MKQRLIPVVKMTLLMHIGGLLALSMIGCAAGNTPAKATASSKIRVLIDSDANNETDDQHAIAYALFSGDIFDVEGITVNKTRNGGEVSEQIKEAVRVIKLCGLYPDIPSYKGANGSFEEILPQIHTPDFDGYEAVNFIIEQAKKKSDRKLVLLAIGKLTNIALALEKDPSIIPNVRVVWLGSNYPKTEEYNLVSDLSAARYLLKCPVDFEMVVVRNGDPSGTWGLQAYLEEILRRMPGLGPQIAGPVVGRHGGEFFCFGDYSADLFSHAPRHGNPPWRSLYDVGAVAVVKNANWAKANVIPRPLLDGKIWVEQPGNPDKMILWDNFDKDAILLDFFSTMENYKTGK